MEVTYGSLFTGVGGFDLGLDRAGMRCVWQVEKDDSCNLVLQKHWPELVRYDDVNRFRSLIEARNANRLHQPRPIRPDLICGGFPCQDVSVAGRRAGLAGSRSGLWFTFRRIVAALRPVWVLIENVPGLLSSNGGRDMGAIVGGLARLGYGWSYRILDSQWFGLAQRRRRVFIVGHLGSVRCAAEVLFERDCLPWDSAPSRQEGKDVAASLTRGADSGGRGGYAGRRREDDVNLVARALTRHADRQDATVDTYVCGTISANGKAAGSATQQDAESGMLVACTLPASTGGASSGMHPVVSAYRTSGNCGAWDQGDKTAALNCATDPNQQIIAYQCQGSNVGPMGTFRAGNGNETGGVPFVAFQSIQSGVREGDLHATLDSNNGSRRHNGIAGASGVRRLTPRECERLQGFPDDWTRWAADGTEIKDSPRYRMMGNAVSVPPAEWIGRRIIGL